MIDTVRDSGRGENRDSTWTTGKAEKAGSDMAAFTVPPSAMACLRLGPLGSTKTARGREESERGDAFEMDLQSHIKREQL